MQACEYRFVVEGELGSRLGVAFEGMRLEPQRGKTSIIGPVTDQAQLQGILDRIASLGLALVSVTPLDDG